MAVSVELSILADYSRLYIYIINTFITFVLPSPVREVYFSLLLPCMECYTTASDGSD